MLRRFSLKEDSAVATNFLMVFSQTFIAGCCHRPGAGLLCMTSSDMKNNNATAAKDTRLVCVLDPSRWVGVFPPTPSSMMGINIFFSDIK